MKSDSFIEKSFVFLLVISVLLHVGAFIVAVYLSKLEPKPPKEPVFIDLQQVPEMKQQQPLKREAQRLAEKQARVKRETAPRGFDMTNRGARRPSVTSAPSSSRPSEEPVKPGSSISGLLKSKSQVAKEQQQRQGQRQPQLTPSSSSLARMEDSYRRKFEKEIAEGTTRFMNADDELFGSFLTRFKSSVYLYWRYPDEAIRRGLEGTTPVKITFNRKGEITKVQVLQSSGYRVLDDEVIRTLKEIGPMGGFPRGYKKDEFNLIGFFHYGGSRGILK